MDQKIKKITDFFYRHQTNLVISLFIGVTLILIQELPFVNLYMPKATPVWVFLVSLVILFRLFIKLKFLFSLFLAVIVLYLFQLTLQAEQLATFIFVLLFIAVIGEIISFYKGIK